MTIFNLRHLAQEVMRNSESADSVGITDAVSA